MNQYQGIDVAVIYCRFSPRRDPTKCVSNERQAEICRRYCQEKDWHVIEVCGDRNASGAKTDRPGLDKAMDLTIKHQATLVVYSISRLCRSLQDAIKLSERLSKHDCNLASVTEMIDTTTPQGRLFFNIMAIIYQFERELIAERTSAGMQHRVESGQSRFGGHIAYGWKPDPNNPETNIPDEHEQYVIQKVQDLYDSGITSDTDICNWLNQRKMLDREGEEWISNLNFRKVKKALRRRNYTPPHKNRKLRHK